MNKDNLFCFRGTPKASEDGSSNYSNKIKGFNYETKVYKSRQGSFADEDYRYRVQNNINSHLGLRRNSKIEC